MQYLSSCAQKIEEFIRSSDQFQQACSAAFDQVDYRGTGRVRVDLVAQASAVFFRDVTAAVNEYGIQVKEPTEHEIGRLLHDSGYKSGEYVNRKQFEELYIAILKYAAIKCAVGFGHKYGVGIAVGFTAVMLLKRAIKAIPVVGQVSRPFLGLLPSPIVGPLLGILAVYLADKGDLSDVRKKLFRGGNRGQFKAG